MQESFKRKSKSPHGWIFGNKKKKTTIGDSAFTKFVNKGSKKHRRKKYIGQGK